MFRLKRLVWLGSEQASARVSSSSLRMFTTTSEAGEAKAPAAPAESNETKAAAEEKKPEQQQQQKKPAPQQQQQQQQKSSGKRNEKSGLVSCDWLKDNLDSENVVIVDGSWYMPSEQRNTKKEFEENRIKGAHFFDIEHLSRKDTQFPHKMPYPIQMMHFLATTTITEDKHIVVYDTKGIFSSARVWWMFRYFGAQNVTVLDGGFPLWKKKEYPTESEPLPKKKENKSLFLTRPTSSLIRDVNQVFTIYKTKSAQIIDARSKERFLGEAKEPREGVRSGHIPGAISIPFANVLDPKTENTTLKRRDELLKVFEDAGVDLKQPIVTSCGSGITACILNLALHEVGAENHALYDGSWTEWGSLPKLPVETGPTKRS